MEKVGIICLLPEEIQNYHQKLRLELVSRFGVEMNWNAPAHITVKYPFPFENISQIEKVAQEFCSSQPKTKWMLRGFNYFTHPDRYVVFIDVLASDEVRVAHQNLLDRLHEIKWVEWGEFDNADLHYHVTLAAHGITGENFAEVWSFLEEQPKPDVDVFFDNLAFVRIGEVSRSVWRKYSF